jgi:hypothetical protein
MQHHARTSRVLEAVPGWAFVPVYLPTYLLRVVVSASTSSTHKGIAVMNVPPLATADVLGDGDGPLGSGSSSGNPA